MAEEFILLEAIAVSKTFTVKENGKYKIEVFGASGSGGDVYKGYYKDEDKIGHYTGISGSGGGGGAYCCSHVELNKNDTIDIQIGAVGDGATTVTFHSTMAKACEVMTVVSGVNGSQSVNQSTPNGGAGGTASGGNIANDNGSDGGPGDHDYDTKNGETIYVTGGAGGQPGHAGGNAGGQGAGLRTYDKTVPRTMGKPGFIKIYQQANTPPTAPTSLTVSKSNCEVGDTLTITAGASADIDGNPIAYTYEYQNNARKWTLLETTGALSCAYEIPIGTSTLRFRVKASDGFEDSGYTYSGPVMVNNPLPDYMEAVVGRAIRAGGSPGLKWTVSPQPPEDPKAGELWVGADPSQVYIETVRHIQTDKKEVEAPAANAIYVLIPAEGYPFVETPVTVDFFNTRKYNLKAQCPYVLVTGDRGETLDIVRGVYTGTEWKTWGERPDIPEQWEFLQAINADTTWTPPESGQWYRVHVFGKCGDGGFYTTNKPGHSNTCYPGAAGGNTGGYACSTILLDDPVPCTVNNSITSFGAYLSATSGGSIGSGTEGLQQPSPTVGTAVGGTDYNLNGQQGAAGDDEDVHEEVDDEGYVDGRIFYGGNGGAGARFKIPYPNCPYIDNTGVYAAGTKGYARHGGGSTGNNWKENGSPAQAYPDLDIAHPVLYGGGQGGGGGAVTTYNSAIGGKGSAGSPGLIIIERAKQQTSGGTTGK